MADNTRPSESKEPSFPPDDQEVTPPHGDVLTPEKTTGRGGDTIVKDRITHSRPTEGTVPDEVDRRAP
jgi:hypothetical protein